MDLESSKAEADTSEERAPRRRGGCTLRRL